MSYLDQRKRLAVPALTRTVLGNSKFDRTSAATFASFTSGLNDLLDVAYKADMFVLLNAMIATFIVRAPLVPAMLLSTFIL